MKVVCLSDLHGHLPDVPKSDIVCISGDVCPDENRSVQGQAAWLLKEFLPWLDGLKQKVFICWGNHDWVGETSYVPNLPCEILTNRVVDYQGYRIAGCPWTTVSTHWAFHKPRAACESYVQSFYHTLTNGLGCDILLNHTPPLLVGDKTLSLESVGSHALKYYLMNGAAKFCITGHIHEGRGNYHLPNGTLVVNASYLDAYYQPYKQDIPVFEVL